eukprot:6882266-Pyramimonas_sp.AAC.1
MPAQVPCLGPLLEPSSGPVGLFWAFLGPSWSPLGPFWGPLEGLLGRVGAIVGLLGPSGSVGKTTKRERQQPSKT